jgi:hypothetical protein
MSQIAWDDRRVERQALPLRTVTLPALFGFSHENPPVFSL